MDLGCDPLRAFVKVTLPLILPAVAAGWMLAFTLSLDDLVIASFTTGPGSTTLPIRIYSEVRLGVKPEINAICTLIIGLIAAVIIAASLGFETVEPAGRKRRAVVKYGLTSLVRDEGASVRASAFRTLPGPLERPPREPLSDRSDARSPSEPRRGSCGP